MMLCAILYYLYYFQYYFLKSLEINGNIPKKNSKKALRDAWFLSKIILLPC